MISLLLLLAPALGERDMGREEDPFAKYGIATLQRMVYVRGISCKNCTVSEYRAVARKNAALPIIEDLAEEYDEMASYEEKAKQLKMSKVDFVHQMTSDEEVDEARADRMWRHFEAQLDSGAVTFLENGTMQFALPITHELAPYLPDAITDTIEESYLAVRKLYVSVPRRYRRRLETRIEWTVDQGIVHALLTLIATFLLVDVGISVYSSMGKDVKSSSEANAA